MSQVKILEIEWVEDNYKCLCGACNHYITKVTLSNGDYWFPTNSEAVAVSEMLKICILHNLSKDKYCFKARPQKVNVQRLLK